MTYEDVACSRVKVYEGGQTATVARTLHYVAPSEMLTIFDRLVAAVQSSDCAPASKELCIGDRAIREKFYTKIAQPSDISEHLDSIRKYASGYSHVTEFGVRHVVSSWALAMAGLESKRGITYIGVDITKRPEVIEFEAIVHSDCIREHINFTFIEADDLTIKPWDTDVLFIDTWHAYRQLSAELQLWAPHVRHIMMFHDTQLFGYKDEDVNGHGGKPVEESLFGGSNATQGLRPALDEFLQNYPTWFIAEDRQNNNGLLVLQQKGDGGTQ